VDAGAAPAAVGGDLEARAGAGRALGGVVRDAARVDGQHQHLVAEAARDLGDHLGAGDRGGVHTALVGTGAQQLVDVLDRAHAAADGQRDEDLLGSGPDHVDHGVPAPGGGGDVEEGELVRALRAVAGGELHRVPGIAQVLEVHTLDD